MAEEHVLRLHLVAPWWSKPLLTIAVLLMRAGVNIDPDRLCKFIASRVVVRRK